MSFVIVLTEEQVFFMYWVDVVDASPYRMIVIKDFDKTKAA